jgi:hypothetical protein
MSPRYQASIIVCARWETQYITEWLLYQRSIGFGHVYLYCNDDDPLPLYGEVLPFCRGDQPFVTFRSFPYQGQQFYMFMHALRHYRQDSEWIAFLDIDEFLRLPGSDNIQTLLNRTSPEVHALHFNWSFFGNSFHAERPAGSVLCTYTRRQDQLHPATKTITLAARIDPARITGKLQFWHHWGESMGPDFR